MSKIGNKKLVKGFNINCDQRKVIRENLNAMLNAQGLILEGNAKTNSKSCLIVIGTAPISDWLKLAEILAPTQM